MRLKELARKFGAILQDRYDEDEVQAIFLVSIAHVLGYSRADYLLNKDENVLAGQLNQLMNILEDLRMGRPVQYVLGETEFFGLPFKVNESVLIPRPETEELVEWVLETIDEMPGVAVNKAIDVLDIGTGSGCIALALKRNVPDAEVFALDISKEALSVAKYNAALNQLYINFINADIGHYITTQKFDVIVSNPPYITLNEKAEMSENVLAHEPHLALFVTNEEPLVHYDSIADFALTNLTESGLLFFEINEYLGKETVDLLYNKGLKNMQLRKDMQGKYRMIRCSRN